MWPDVITPWFSVYVRSDEELPMIDCMEDRGSRIQDVCCRVLVFCLFFKNFSVCDTWRWRWQWQWRL